MLSLNLRTKVHRIVDSNKIKLSIKVVWYIFKTNRSIAARLNVSFKVILPAMVVQ